MTKHNIKGCHILVVEDEYLLATHLADEISNAGAFVIGPAGTLEKAIRLIKETAAIEAAVLDVNLRGEMVYPAADMLMEQETPFLFFTGYDFSVIPQRFKEIIKCAKSDSANDIIEALKRAMAGDD